jgi:hypothetical protein
LWEKSRQLRRGGEKIDILSEDRLISGREPMTNRFNPAEGRDRRPRDRDRRRFKART